MVQRPEYRALKFIRQVHNSSLPGIKLKLLTLPNGFLMLSRPFRGSGLTVF